MKNSIIIPVYNNEDSISSLLDELEKIQTKMILELEVVFVIDGSPDNSYHILKDKLRHCTFNSQLLLQSRNFGSFSAIRAGLKAATGDYCAVMAADLQEPPELVLKMLQNLATNEYDIVVGYRERRNDPLISRTLSKIFWWTYRKLIIAEIPPGGVDMFGCNQQFREELLKLDEQHSSLIGLIYWLGFRRKSIGYERKEREHGKSGWTLSKKINYLLDSVFAFSDLPIKVLIFLGISGLIVATLLTIIVISAKLISNIVVPGYAATMITILSFGAFNSLGLGIIGSYVWRAYGNTQRRPLSIIRTSEFIPAKLRENR
jgi:glycosyltransferase involved in cell wall biosynthesis